MPPKKPVSKSAPKRTVRRTAPRIEDLPATDRIPLLLYRRIAITFTVLVAAALLIVVYLSTMQAVIHIKPTQSALKTEFIAQIMEVPINPTDVAGQVRSGVVAKTQTFKSSGTGAVQVEGLAEGTVTLHNDQSSAQQLVVKTRLLDPKGTQFRLLESVNVPAKGSVVAKVRADVKGAVGDIAPSKFTIPGLSEAKQLLVYAQSAEAFTGGVTSLSVVTQEEIDASAMVLKNSLKEDAVTMMRAESAKGFSGEAFFDEITKQSVSIEPNTQADAYDVTLEVKVTGVFFDKEAIERIAEQKLYDQIGQGHELVSVDKEHEVITVDKYNLEDHTASLRVELTGQSVSSRTSESLDLDRFLGLSEKEVQDLLVTEGIASEVRVEFFPFWVKTVPRLKDHVSIKISE